MPDGAEVLPSVLNGLFEKQAFSSRRVHDDDDADAPQPTGGDPTAPISPLNSFLDRLFPTGDFLEKIASEKGRNGGSRASYFKGRQQQSEPTKKKALPARGMPSPRARAQRGAAAPSPSLHRGASSAPVSARRQSSAEERQRRIREREAEQADLEQSQKSSEEREAAARALTAAEERQQRIRDRMAAEVSSREGGSSARAMSSVAGLRSLAAPSTVEAQRQREEQERWRLEQKQKAEREERAREERRRLAEVQRRERELAKRREQQEVAQRKAEALKEKAESRQRQNDEKRERARRVHLEGLEKQRQKALEKQASKDRAIAAAREPQPTHEWWCDVAADGCLRPVEGCYPAQRYWCCGQDYTVCEACFEAELTPEQQSELTEIDPRTALERAMDGDVER